jgi:hypothetical protein
MSWTPPKQPPAPPKPVVPWFPNEAPTLDAATNLVRRAIREIDSLVVDLTQSVAGVWWLGTDADNFRQRWHAETQSLSQLRVRLMQVSASLGQTSINEETRFRVQERQP